MSDPYLIAHKVRGEPAFDVAVRMECPHCSGEGENREPDIPLYCAECDGLGYWWIIPTSGHRAYPWFNQPLAEIVQNDVMQVTECPPHLPDHYHLDRPTKPKSELIEMLGLNKPATTPAKPIPRRL